MIPVVHLAETPPCSTPEALELVDATFLNRRGPAAEKLRRRYCNGCPVGETCLLLGMTNGEHGVWGGVNTHDRVAHGAPEPQYSQRKAS